MTNEDARMVAVMMLRTAIDNANRTEEERKKDEELEARAEYLDFLHNEFGKV